MLAAEASAADLVGLEVVDRRGERIGRVRQVYPEGGALGWVGVRGNLLGTEEALLPLDGAVLDDDVVAVTVAKDRFAAAPRRRPDAALNEREREHLRRYWSGAEPSAAAPAAEASAPPAAGTPVDASAAVEAEEGAGVMTASEERLHVETERVPHARVRLRKVVVTEQRTITVPVRREEYRLVREPIVDAEPVPGGVIGPAEQEVVLYEERVVLTTEVVPVERIRLVKEEVVDTREVAGAVRLERIELEDDTEAEEPVAPQPAARAIAVKRSTSSRSPRSEGSTPARSSTSAAAVAPPSTGASD